MSAIMSCFLFGLTVTRMVVTFISKYKVYKMSILCLIDRLLKHEKASIHNKLSICSSCCQSNVHSSNVKFLSKNRILSFLIFICLY